MKARRKTEMPSQGAFTLVEILAALAFLGIVLPVVVSALTGAGRASEAAERSLRAAQLGENRLGELLMTDDWRTAPTRGNFGETAPGYRWELSRRDWKSGAMTELSLNVYYTVRGREQVLNLSTLASETIADAAAGSDPAATPGQSTAPAP